MGQVGVKLVKFAAIKKFLVVIFFVLIGLAILSIVLRLPSIGVVLLLADFIIAAFVEVFASLQLREEEEEKLFKLQDTHARLAVVSGFHLTHPPSQVFDPAHWSFRYTGSLIFLPVLAVHSLIGIANCFSTFGRCILL